MRWKQPAEPLVLLGWGTARRLVDLVRMIGTPEEPKLLSLPVTCQHPSDYRRLSICSAEEVAAFKTYASWLKTQVELGNV